MESIEEPSGYRGGLGGGRPSLTRGQAFDGGWISASMSRSVTVAPPLRARAPVGVARYGKTKGPRFGGAFPLSAIALAPRQEA